MQLLTTAVVSGPLDDLGLAASPGQRRLIAVAVSANGQPTGG